MFIHLLLLRVILQIMAEDTTVKKSRLVRSVAALSDEQLLELRTEVHREMRRRGLSFSVGELGETLVIAYYKSRPGLPKLQLAPRGTKSVDALSRDGERFSIKAVLDAKKTGTIYPDAHDENKQLFEYLIMARLDEQFTLSSVHQLTWEQFKVVRCWDTRMSAWYVPYTTKALAIATKVL
jgi:hypothetical protein